MEKENKKNQKEYLKEERKRIFKLVEQAMNLDPRIKQEKADEEAEILKVKEAKKAANKLKYAKKEDNSAQVKEDKIGRLDTSFYCSMFAFIPKSSSVSSPGASSISTHHVWTTTEISSRFTNLCSDHGGSI